MRKASEPDAPDPRLRLRIVFEDGRRLGPGKADLLERIRDTGSIAAAGRAMSMSYKRAWSLVEEMNRAFQAPLVERSRGGPQGGGARVTELGEAVLGEYRAAEAEARAAGERHVDRLQAMLRDRSGDR